MKNNREQDVVAARGAAGQYLHIKRLIVWVNLLQQNQVGGTARRQCERESAAAPIGYISLETSRERSG